MKLKQVSYYFILILFVGITFHYSKKYLTSFPFKTQREIQIEELNQQYKEVAKSLQRKYQPSKELH